MPYDPRYLDVVRWASLTAALVSQFGPLPTVRGKDDFANWASAFAALPKINRYQVLNYKYAASWQDWAISANQALYTLGL